MGIRRIRNGGQVSSKSRILLCALTTLAATLLVGCDSLFDWGDSKYGRSENKQRQGGQQQTPSEAVFLLDIAKRLGIDEPYDKTPGDIAFDIERCLNHSTSYCGGTLSSDAFANIREAILNPEEQKMFQAYHDFIRKVEGRRILILE